MRRSESNLLFVVGHSMHAAYVSLFKPLRIRPLHRERDSIANTVSRCKTSTRISPRGLAIAAEILHRAHARHRVRRRTARRARVIPLPRLARPGRLVVSTEAPRTRAAPIVSDVVLVVVVVVGIAPHPRASPPRASRSPPASPSSSSPSPSSLVLRVAVCSPSPRAVVARRRHGDEMTNEGHPDHDSSRVAAKDDPLTPRAGRTVVPRPHRDARADARDAREAREAREEDADNRHRLFFFSIDMSSPLAVVSRLRRVVDDGETTSADVFVQCARRPFVIGRQQGVDMRFVEPAVWTTRCFGWWTRGWC